MSDGAARRDSVLTPGEVARLERLTFGLRRPVGGTEAGAHRARSRGRSLDFADWRDYQPGDDPRSIDVQAWARLDQVLIRLYEADVDLALNVIVDTSASMGFGAKHHQAVRVAATLAVMGLARQEVVTVTRLVDRHARRRRGRGAIGALLAEMATWTPEGDTPLETAIRTALARSSRRGLVVVVSDFFADGWERAIDRLGAHGDGILAVVVRSDDDDSPDIVGEVQLVDVETGRLVDVDVTPQLLDEVAGRRAERRHAIAARAARHGGRSVEVGDRDGLFEVVVPALLTTELVR